MAEERAREAEATSSERLRRVDSEMERYRREQVYPTFLLSLAGPFVFHRFCSCALFFTVVRNLDKSAPYCHQV